MLGLERFAHAPGEVPAGAVVSSDRCRLWRQLAEDLSENARPRPTFGAEAWPQFGQEGAGSTFQGPRIAMASGIDAWSWRAGNGQYPRPPQERVFAGEMALGVRLRLPSHQQSAYHLAAPHPAIRVRHRQPAQHSRIGVRPSSSRVHRARFPLQRYNDSLPTRASAPAQSDVEWNLAHPLQGPTPSYSVRSLSFGMRWFFLIPTTDKIRDCLDRQLARAEKRAQARVCGATSAGAVGSPVRM